MFVHFDGHALMIAWLILFVLQVFLNAKYSLRAACTLGLTRACMLTFVEQVALRKASRRVSAAAVASL